MPDRVAAPLPGGPGPHLPPCPGSGPPVPAALLAPAPSVSAPDSPARARTPASEARAGGRPPGGRYHRPPWHGPTTSSRSRRSGSGAGPTRAPTRSTPTTPGLPGTCSPCTPTRRARPTWATSATTPSATCSSAIGPCRATPCSRPSASTPSGLPAENAAIKTGTHPRIFTEARIAELKAVDHLASAPSTTGAARSAATTPSTSSGTRSSSRAAGRRPRLPRQGPGQLVPGLPDRAGQRAGAGRRHLRALRRPGRQARSRAVVLPDHRLCRRAAGRSRRPRLAGAGQDHAAQLDRPVRRRRVRPAGRGARRLGRQDRSPSGCSPPGRTPPSA